MTPDQRNTIIGQITQLLESGKYPAEIAEILHASGLDLPEAKHLVFEATSQVKPVYCSRTYLEGAPDSAYSTIRKFVPIVCLLAILSLCLVRWYTGHVPPAPVAPLQPGPSPADAAATVPDRAPSPNPAPVWASGKATQIPPVEHNTYDYYAGSFRYGIVRYECPPGGSTGNRDLQWMGKAQAIAKAKYGAGYSQNSIHIVSTGGRQQMAYLQYICILLSDTKRGGVYCGTILPVDGFFCAEVSIIDPKRIEYQEIFNESASAGPQRYPIIGRMETEHLRKQETRKRKTRDEARAIVLPRIEDWLTQNGYDEQSKALIKVSEERFDGITCSFKVEGDARALKDEMGCTLFTVSVDCKSGKVSMQLHADCAEFLRVLRERALAPAR